MKQNSHFSDRLTSAIRKKKSIACVGLDPQIAHIPEFLRSGGAPVEAILKFNKGLIDGIYDLVPVVKLQIAFYELFGSEGIRVFQESIAYARGKGLLTIADAKRNDVGHTAEAYSEAFLGSDGFDVDALTVTPYLGWDGVKPFVEACAKYGKGIFVLVKTSNSSSGDLQDLEIRSGGGVRDLDGESGDGGGVFGGARIGVFDSGMRIYEAMGHYVDSWGANDIGDNGYSCVGAVVGATFPEEARRLRAIMPQTIFLVPGYGVQGGDSVGVRACLNSDGLGAIVNSSRGIIFAWEKGGGGYGGVGGSGDGVFGGDADGGRGAAGVGRDRGGVSAGDPKKYAEAARNAVIAMNKDLKFTP